MTRTDGAIPQKVRELIPIGVTLTTQCAYCLASHTGAVQLGVARRSWLKSYTFGSKMRAGAAVAHGMLGNKLFQNASQAAVAAA